MHQRINCFWPFQKRSRRSQRCFVVVLATWQVSKTNKHRISIYVYRESRIARNSIKNRGSMRHRNPPSFINIFFWMGNVRHKKGRNQRNMKHDWWRLWQTARDKPYYWRIIFIRILRPRRDLLRTRQRFQDILARLFVIIRKHSSVESSPISGYILW